MVKECKGTQFYGWKDLHFQPESNPDHLLSRPALNLKSDQEFALNLNPRTILLHGLTMANSEDPDQRSSLIWLYACCHGIWAQKEIIVKLTNAYIVVLVLVSLTTNYFFQCVQIFFMKTWYFSQHTSQTLGCNFLFIKSRTFLVQVVSFVASVEIWDYHINKKIKEIPIFLSQRVKRTSLLFYFYFSLA